MRKRGDGEAERCESGCSEPVAHHDVEGVPLCQACWDELIAAGPDAYEDAPEEAAVLVGEAVVVPIAVPPGSGEARGPAEVPQGTRAGLDMMRSYLDAASRNIEEAQRLRAVARDMLDVPLAGAAPPSPATEVPQGPVEAAGPDDERPVPATTSTEAVHCIRCGGPKRRGQEYVCNACVDLRDWQHLADAWDRGRGIVTAPFASSSPVEVIQAHAEGRAEGLRVAAWEVRERHAENEAEQRRSGGWEEHYYRGRVAVLEELHRWLEDPRRLAASPSSVPKETP